MESRKPSRVKKVPRDPTTRSEPISTVPNSVVDYGVVPRFHATAWNILSNGALALFAAFLLAGLSDSDAERARILLLVASIVGTVAAVCAPAVLRVPSRLWRNTVRVAASIVIFTSLYFIDDWSRSRKEEREIPLTFKPGVFSSSQKKTIRHQLYTVRLFLKRLGFPLHDRLPTISLAPVRYESGKPVSDGAMLFGDNSFSRQWLSVSSMSSNIPYDVVTNAVAWETGDVILGHRELTMARTSASLGISWYLLSSYRSSPQPNSASGIGEVLWTIRAQNREFADAMAIGLIHAFTDAFRQESPQDVTASNGSEQSEREYIQRRLQDALLIVDAGSPDEEHKRDLAQAMVGH